MLKRLLILSTLFIQFGGMTSTAQNICATTDKTKLYCLIPTALHTPAAQFNFFNTAFATQT